MKNKKILDDVRRDETANLALAPGSIPLREGVDVWLFARLINNVFDFGVAVESDEDGIEIEMDYTCDQPTLLAVVDTLGIPFGSFVDAILSGGEDALVDKLELYVAHAIATATDGEISIVLEEGEVRFALTFEGRPLTGSATTEEMRPYLVLD